MADKGADDNFQAEVTPTRPEDVPPPPSYEEVMGLYKTSVLQSTTELPSLAYIDIMPRLVHPGNIAHSIAPTFQTFTDIVIGANVWLRDHRDLSVWKCETVERKVNAVSATGQVSVDLDAMSHSESIFGFNCFVFGLRLWLTKKTQGAAVQELGLINILPQTMKIDPRVYHSSFLPTRIGFEGNFFGHPYMAMARNMTLELFEGVKKTLERFNATLKDKPIPGSILNVESTFLKFAESYQPKMPVETAATAGSWHELSGTSSKRFTQILRLFYVTGPPTRHEIKMEEFLPAQIDGREFSMNLKFVKFNTVLEQVATWIQQQQDIKIVNLETKDARVNQVFGRAEVETDSANYFQFGKMNEHRLRFIRVFYVDNPQAGSFAHTAMTSRNFVPVRLNSIRFETMTQTMDRIDAWLKVTGLPIFGVETVRYLKERIAGSAINTSDYPLMVFSSKSWVTAIRVYFPSDFQEPDASLLPPLPARKSSTCVVL